MMRLLGASKVVPWYWISSIQGGHVLVAMVLMRMIVLMMVMMMMMPRLRVTLVEPGTYTRHLPKAMEKIMITRSYAALRAADLDWIIMPGYSWGGISSKKNMKNQPGTMKNQPGTRKADLEP